jgi:hypothetical protein
VNAGEPDLLDILINGRRGAAISLKRKSAKKKSIVLGARRRRASG